MIEDHQLMNLATIHWMRGRVDSLCPAFHPFMLPLREGSPVIVDHSLPIFTLPLVTRTLPQGELGEILQPLAELCQRYRGHFPEGRWAYRWFYYELLDRDGRVRPLCWMDPRLLHAQFEMQAIGESTQVRPALPGEDAFSDLPDCQEQERIDGFVRHWRQNEQLWMSEGLLRWDPVPRWLSMLRFDRAAAEEEARRSIGAAGYVGPNGPMPLEAAWYPGLRWNMVPLYDQRQWDAVVWAMKEDLFTTSIFNPAAGSVQSRKLWQRLDDRFGPRFMRMSRQEFRSRLREKRIMELHQEGLTLPEIARSLLKEGLHPLDETTARGVRESTGDERRMWESRALDAVRTVTRSLRKRHLIPKRKPGRPRRK